MDAASQLIFAQHYSQRLRTIGDGAFGGGAAMQQAFQMFETDRDNIAAAFTLVARHWRENDAWARLAARFSLGAGRLLSFRLHADQRAIWLQLQAEAAERIGDLEAQGAAIGELALALRALGHLDDALACHERALGIAQARGDRLASACEYGNLGIVHSVAARHEAAIEAFEVQLGILGDQESEAAAVARNNLVISLLELGDLERAAEELATARHVASRSGDVMLEARLLGSAAGLLSQEGDRAGAVAAYREQFSLARILEDRGVEANALIGMALVLADYGETEGAERRLADAVRAARAGDDRQAEAIACINLARLLAGRGARQDAVRAATHALAWYQAVGDPYSSDVAAMITKWSVAPLPDADEGG